MVGNEANDISWKELMILMVTAAGGVLFTLRFTELNPGWGLTGEWPAGAWIMGCLALACVAGFLSAAYFFYLKRRYGRFAPCMLAAFITLHAVVALLVMNRVG